MNHHENCDVNDANLEGIQKPCNCGALGPADGSRLAGLAIRALEQGHSIPPESRLEAAKFLLGEVMSWHADPESPDYNQCEKPEERCHWCANAALVMEAKDDSPAMRRMLFHIAQKLNIALGLNEQEVAFLKSIGATFDSGENTHGQRTGE